MLLVTQFSVGILTHGSYRFEFRDIDIDKYSYCEPMNDICS